jgi:YVTN family beta-propeller protein
MKLFLRFALAALAVFNFQRTFADDFATTTATVGQTTNGLVTPVNQITTPAGTQIELPGIRPNTLALSPDGKLLVTSGLTNKLIVINPATAQILQRVPFPTDTAAAQAVAEASSENLNANKKSQLSFTGLAFSPDGKRIYMANVNGDIKVFAVSKTNDVSPMISFALPPAYAPKRTNEIPAGIAISHDGTKIYVAGNLSNRLLEMDAASGEILRTWNVGVAPFDVALCKNKIYVSNWGGRRPDANSTTGPSGKGTRVRVDERSIASEGSVSVIDLNSAANNPQIEILTGLHTCALTPSPDGKFLVAANSGSDTLSVIDTSADKIVETISARQTPGDPFGAEPNALAFDKSGKNLFVCNGAQNAVAVIQFKPGNSKMLGLIPAGWFPGGIQFDAMAKRIYVANIKHIGTKMGRPRRGFGEGLGFNTYQYDGSLSLIPVPSKRDLQIFTQTALANLRYPLLAQSKFSPRTSLAAVPVPERVGEPSVFQHIIYIIKENRTYDQILGDVTSGNGDLDLCAFGERVTPNQHKFVHDFVLLDNTYCCGILSADGHNWTDTGITTDYMEREFAGFPRSYPSGGGEEDRDALAYSPAGFIWNNALAHGKTVVDFGEFTTGKNHWADESRKKKLTFLDCWRDFTNGANEIVYESEPDIEALRLYLVTNWPSWDLSVPDQVRSKIFRDKLKEFEAADNLPNLTIIWLPNDHTSATKTNCPTPSAMIADNDLAFGQIVEAVSHSKFWTNSCIFAIEDDPQNGWEHVSGYRTTAYVISPFTKRGAAIHTQYNQTSILRTMELMLGLPPMNQMDATATPMFDCFTNTPDFAGYDVLTNNVPLDEMNPPRQRIQDAQLRRDAIVSAKLPLDKADQCPEDVLNQILWRAVKGTQTPYPAWAVKMVDDN